MPVEVIVAEIEKQRKIIAEAEKKQSELIGQLSAAIVDDGNDWISPKAAAARIGKSLPFVYALINSGKLKKVKHISSGKYVSRSELDAIDDTFGDQR